MGALKVLAVLLIAGGVLGLVYHHVSYTRDQHAAKIGSLELSIQKRESVDVPEWVGVGAVVAGVVLLLFGGGARR